MVEKLAIRVGEPVQPGPGVPVTVFRIPLSAASRIRRIEKGSHSAMVTWRELAGPQTLRTYHRAIPGQFSAALLILR